MEEILKALREKYKDRSVCVGIPSGDMVHTHFMISLVEMFCHCGNFISMGMVNGIGSRIAVNRNNIVDGARRQGYTDILWLDTDGRFPVNSLLSLLTHDKDIVGATTSGRVDSSKAAIGKPLGGSNRVAYQRLIPMENMGFHFMLTRLSVFDTLPKPYFAEVPRRFIEPDAKNGDDLLGEDVYFCHQARNAGLEIFCDMQLSSEIGHIGQATRYIEQVDEFPANVNLTLVA